MAVAKTLVIFLQFGALFTAQDFDTNGLRGVVERSVSSANLTEPDCGPRCLALVLSLVGKPTSWDELRQRFRITDRGVSLSDVRNVASEFSCSLMSVRAPGSRVRQLAFPAIGQLEPSTQLSTNHFVIVLEIQHDTVFVLDPSREVIDTIPIDSFIEIATGNYLMPASSGRNERIMFAGLFVVAGLILMAFRIRRGAGKIVASVSLFILCCGCSGERDPAPPKYSLIMVEPDRVDLGTLLPTGDSSVRFTVRNVSRRSLKLGVGSRSCGCLEARLVKETLEPDEATECLLEFRLRNRAPGLFAESATITVPEFHETHDLSCGGFIQGATISGGATTIFGAGADGNRPKVVVQVYHARKTNEVRLEKVDVTLPGITPDSKATAVGGPEKLALEGFRRLIEIPLKVEASRQSGRGIVSVTLSIDGERQLLNADLNYIRE